MPRALRNIRIVVSVVFLVLLTLAIVDAAFGVTPIGRWLLSVQIIPAILTGAVGWIVFWVIATITFGRVYCSTVCPLGTIQDIAARCGHISCRSLRRGRLLSLDYGSKRYRYSPPVDVLRYSVPLIVAGCLFVGLTAVVEATDPYTIYYRVLKAITRPAAIAFGGVGTAAAVILIISAVAWRKGRVLCNTICPAGGFMSLLGRQPIYRVDINTDLCIHCGKCEDVCKSECINLKDCVVDNSRCVMCLDCTAVCPNSAITVRRGRHVLSTPLMQPSN